MSEAATVEAPSDRAAAAGARQQPSAERAAARPFSGKLIFFSTQALKVYNDLLCEGLEVESNQQTKQNQEFSNLTTQQKKWKLLEKLTPS